jgi:hypothetical protein
MILAFAASSGAMEGCVDVVALKACTGKYVSVQDDNTLTAVWATAIGIREKFDRIWLADGRYVLRSQKNRKYVSVLNLENYPLVAAKDTVDTWEMLCQVRDDSNAMLQMGCAPWNFIQTQAGSGALAACSQKYSHKETFHIEVISGYFIDFLDNFAGTSLNQFDDNWSYDRPWVNYEQQCYMLNGENGTVSVGGKMLTIACQELGSEISCDNWDKWGNKHGSTRYVSARLVSKCKKFFAGGRWTARCRVNGAGAAGQKPAWWLLGEFNDEGQVSCGGWQCWPKWGSGEIDIMEYLGSQGSAKFTHRCVYNSNGVCDGADKTTFAGTGDCRMGEWNTFSAEWSGADIVIYLNNNAIKRYYGKASEYAEPFFAVISYAIENGGGGTPGIWTMNVAYVAHEMRR